jgi:hypothetical protein
MILDLKNLHADKEKSFPKNYIFRIILINLLAAFQGFLDVLIGQKPCWKAVAMLMKLFWKPISKT